MCEPASDGKNESVPARKRLVRISKCAWTRWKASKWHNNFEPMNHKADGAADKNSREEIKCVCVCSSFAESGNDLQERGGLTSYQICSGNS